MKSNASRATSKERQNAETPRQDQEEAGLTTGGRKVRIESSVSAQTFNVRVAESSNHESMSALGLEPRDTAACSIVERDGIIVGAGSIDSASCHDEAPTLTIRTSRSITNDEKRALVEHLVQRARGDRLDRLIAHVDPMNYKETSLYESLGFKPTGRGPYIDLGGGQVQYITGYQNAAGSILDLSIAL